MTEEDVTNLFAAHGVVERAKLIMDRDTGRSRGFAFVTMRNQEEGQAAITTLNGSEQQGRSITVRQAEPRQPGGAGGGGGGGGGGRGGFGGGGGGGGGGRREDRGGGGGGFGRDRR